MNAVPWRVWVLGSGTALPSAQRDNTYLALEAGSGCWLIDCGAAPYRRLLRAGLAPENLQGVILTHSHADHIYGLPALLFQLALTGRETLLPIYGLPETLRVAQQVVEAFELGEHCVPHEWRTLAVSRDINIPSPDDPQGRLHFEQVTHSRPCMGVRVTAPNGWVAAYSADTEPCAGLLELARGAQWLIHECTVPQPLPGHSTPEDVAHTAAAAGVERLGIVHYDPLYVLGQEELLERIVRAGFRGEVRVLADMDAVLLG
jgi:ribonuclease Z